MQGSNSVAHVSQTVSQDVGIALGAGEHHSLVHFLGGQQVIQQVILVGQCVSQVQALFDVVVAVCVRGHSNVHGISTCQALSQLAHVTGKRRAEHQCLTFCWCLFSDGFDVIDEAHVQHAVGFVQNQHFQVGQHGSACTQVIQQTARCGNQHIQRALQGLQLGAIRHAAHDGGHAQTLQMLAVGRCSLGNLHGQFTSWCQHQNARTVYLAFFTTLVVATGSNNALQGWQHEGGSLATTCAGCDQQVSAIHGSRNGLYLNGGWVCVAGVSQCLAQV